MASLKSSQSPTQQYWKKNVGIVAGLLGVWLLVTVLPIWFADELSSVVVFGFPLSFYMVAQGSLIVYVALIWAYHFMMVKLDKQFGFGDEEKE